jgi:raffinose/stachyose/melibiose transport system substrate-binding protein
MAKESAMKMKRILAMAVLTVLVTSSLAACGSKADDSKESGGGKDSGSDQVTLTVWGDTDNQATLEAPFTEINEAFEKAHPDIKIDYQWSGTFDSINVAVQSDTLPDLFWVQGNKSTKMAELANNDYILNLDEYNLDASRYPESAVEYATVDGSVYCNYPGFFDYVTVYYNKQIFEENGVEIPETFADFEAAVKTFAEKGITPISGSGNGEFDRYWPLQLLAPAMCADTMDAISNHEEPDYTSMAKMFDKYKEYAENQYFGKDFQSTDGSGAQLAFTNGKAAMIVDGTWNNALYRDLSFDIGAFAIPDESGEKYGQSGESNFTTYAVSKKTEYPEQAVEYLKFLSSQEAEQIMEDRKSVV